MTTQPAKGKPLKKSSKTQQVLSTNKIEVAKIASEGTVLATGRSEIAKSGMISFGINPPVSYGNNEGVWLGYDAGPKMSLYSNENNFLQWDGTRLLIQALNFTLDELGNITANDATLSGTITAVDGAIGGWTIGETSFYSDSIYLDSDTPAIRMGSATDYLVGTGLFLGKSSGVYKLHFGDPTGQYFSWDGSALQTGGNWIGSTAVNPTLQSWSTDIVFSDGGSFALDWTSGTIALSDGVTTYNIVAGTTGALSALTYVYLDVATSLTVLQYSTDYDDAVGDGKILVAAGQNTAGGIAVIPYGGQQPIVDGANLSVGSVTAGAIAAGAITADKLNVSSLSAITAIMGALTINDLLTLSGTSSAITIGETPPTSNSLGTGLWIDRTGIYGLNSNVEQVKVDAETGKIVAAAGLMFIDSEGITGDQLLKWMIRQSATSGDYGRIGKIGMSLALDENIQMPVWELSYKDEITSGEAVTNGDFETGDATGWTVTSNTPVGLNGTMGMDVDVEVVEGSSYSLIFKNSGSGDNAYSYIPFNDSSSNDEKAWDYLTSGFRSWTNHGATQETTIKKFGTSSAYFDGTSTNYIDTPDDIGFQLDDRDFTFDCWFYIPTGSIGGTLFGQCDSSLNNASIAVDAQGGSLGAKIWYGTAYADRYNISGGSYSLDTWHHVAFVRSGSTFTLYLDGTSVGTPVTYAGSVNNSNKKFAIARLGEYSTFGTTRCYIDEFRMVNGTAIWTSNFTPPTAAYIPEGTASIGWTTKSTNYIDITGSLNWTFSGQIGKDTQDTVIPAMLFTPMGGTISIEWYDATPTLLSTTELGSKEDEGISYLGNSPFSNNVTVPTGATQAKVRLDASFNTLSATPKNFKIYFDNLSLIPVTIDERLWITDTGVNSTHGIYPTHRTFFGDEARWLPDGEVQCITPPITIDNGQIQDFYISSSGTSDDDEYYFYPFLEAGIYSMRWFCAMATNGCYFDIYFDDEWVTQWNSYSGATRNNKEHYFHGLVAKYSGTHTIKFIPSGSPSGTARGILLTKAQLYKAGEYYSNAVEINVQGTGYDTDIDSSNPTTTRYSNTTVIIGERNDAAASVRRGLFYWDEIDDIPAGSTILSAVMKLRLTTNNKSSNTRDWYVHLIDRDCNGLLEYFSDTTWRKYDATNDWATYGAEGTGDYTDNGGYFDPMDYQMYGEQFIHLDITRQVQAIADGHSNYGFLVTANNFSELNDMLTVSSVEDTTAEYRPVLQIFYLPPQT